MLAFFSGGCSDHSVPAAGPHLTHACLLLQCGRCDGYILEGRELEFYLKKMAKKKVGDGNKPQSGTECFFLLQFPLPPKPSFSLCAGQVRRIGRLGLVSCLALRTAVGAAG